jgi:hypothetical protein
MIDEKDKSVIMQVLEALIQAMDGRDSNKLDDMEMKGPENMLEHEIGEEGMENVPEHDTETAVGGKMSPEECEPGMEQEEKPAGSEQMPEGFAEMIARKKKEKEYA